MIFEQGQFGQNQFWQFSKLTRTIYERTNPTSQFWQMESALSSDFDGWQVSWWEVMVSWHSCTFISWEKPRELPHFIFLLLSLMLHDSKLMLKLYYLRVPTSLLTGCDTKVALDSKLSLGAWKQKLTTINRRKQSVKGINLPIEISLTKVFKCGLLISGRLIKEK